MIGTFEEAVDRVVALLDSRTIYPTIYWLHDGEYQAAMMVDPDVAFAALQRYNEAGRNAVTDD